MKKIVIFLFLTVYAFAGLVVEIESGSFKEVYTTLSSDEFIQKLIQMKKIPKSQLPSIEQNLSKDDQKRYILQQRYDRVKKLLAYLPEDTTLANLKERLRDYFFKFYASQKEEFSFVFKVEYPNTMRYDDAYKKLQEQISLYLLKKYGVSNVKYSLVLKNMQFSSEDIQNLTIGTVEAYAEKNIDNKYYFDVDKTTVSGVASFLFYPFVIVKRNEKEIISSPTTSNDQLQIQYKEIRSLSDLEALDFSLNPKDKENIQSFFQNNTKEYTTDVGSVLNKISAQVDLYQRVAKELFALYPQCQTLGCLDKTIKKELDSIATITKEKTLVYDNIYLSNDDDFEFTLLLAFRKLQKNLKRDTMLNSLQNTQSLHNDTYTTSSKKSALTPIIKTVEVIPFVDNGRLGLYFIVKVSYKENDVCLQYVKGKTYDTLLGMELVKLKKEDGSIIAVSQTEVTNKVFQKIYPNAPREEQCKRTFGAKSPVNCISYETLKKFFEKLNKKSKQYTYRLLSCEEAMFFATCGKKQKYCWGNTKDYKKFEFIQKDKYDVTLKTVAKREPNGLGLYDFCGNAAEYCRDKRRRYKVLTINRYTLLPKIAKYAWRDISSFRIVREERE